MNNTVCTCTTDHLQQDNQFFQDHGCCQMCFYIGSDWQSYNEEPEQEQKAKAFHVPTFMQHLRDLDTVSLIDKSKDLPF